MDRMKKIAEEPTQPLFHYTTIDGLLGIFRENKMWATSVFHLNDKSELSLAAGIFKDAIEELRRKAKLPMEPALPPPGYERDPRARFLDALAYSTEIAPEAKIFVCSFSEEGNQLSQWRGYCPNGHGFSIGFDYPKLKEHIRRQGFRLVKCIYNENKHRQCIDQYVKKIVAPKLQGLNRENYSDRLVESVVRLFHILPILKDYSFREEREWRLISAFRHESEQVKFRAGRTTLIPYYEFELTDVKNEGQALPIESIIVGPTPNEKESLQAITALFPGRPSGYPPGPPRFRTCPIKASGSSVIRASAPL